MKNRYLNSGMAFLVALTTLPSAWAQETGSIDASAVEASVTAVAEKGVPGGVIIEKYNLHAKVVAIDYATRNITLKGPLGGMLTVTAGPEAVNFDQIKKGDYINASVTRTLEVYLGDEADALNDGSAELVALAPKGAAPAGMIAGTSQQTAKVAAIDAANRTAILEFENGVKDTVNVRPDIDLNSVQLGQRVVIRSTEVISISMEANTPE